MDPELEKALALSLAEAARPRLEAGAMAAIARAFGVASAPDSEHSLDAAVAQKLKATELPAQLALAAGAARATASAGELAQACVLRYGREVLLDRYKMFEDLGVFGSLQSSGTSKIQAIRSLCDQEPDFMRELLLSVSPEQANKVFGGSLKEMAATVSKQDLESPELLKALTDLAFVASLRSGRDVLAGMMQSDTISAAAVSGRDLEATGIGCLFAAGPKQEFPAPGAAPPQPAPPSSLDPESQLRSIQMQVERVQALYKQILFAVVKDKRHKETALAWLASVFTHNTLSADEERRLARTLFARSRRASFRLLCNLTHVCLALCEPFFSADSKAHNKFQRFDSQWFRNNKRYPVAHLPTLGAGMANTKDAAAPGPAGASATASAADGMDFEMDADEAADLAAAIQLSLSGSVSSAEPEPAEVVAPPQSFHFVTEIFFLTLCGIHASVIPSLAEYAKVQKAFREWYDRERATNPDVNALVKHPQYQQFQATQHGFEAALFNDTFLGLLTRFQCLTAAWLVHLQASPQRPDAKAVFDIVPEFVVKDLATCVSQVVRQTPVLLATAPECEAMLSFLGMFLNAPHEVVKSVILRQGLADVLLQVCTGMDRSGRHRPRACMVLQDRIFRNAMCEAHVIPGLVRLFVDVGYVEEAMEVFDKNAARTKTGETLKEMLTFRRFATTFHGHCAKPDTFEPFAKALLSDAVFLFNDALGRLSDVQAMQKQMADTAKWEAKPAREQAEGRRYFQQIELTAKSFMSMAVRVVRTLLSLCKDPEVSGCFVASEELTSRLCQTVNNFISKLCGPRTATLKVKNPERYAWDPKELLRTVGDVFAACARQPAFLAGIPKAAGGDLKAYVRARDTLARRCAAGPEVDAALERLLAAAPSPAAGHGAAGGDEDARIQAMLEAVPGEDLAKEVDFSDLADSYREQMQGLVFAAAPLRDPKPATTASSKQAAVQKAKAAVAAAGGGSDSDDSDSDDSDSDSDDDDDDEPLYTRHHYGQMIEKALGTTKGKMARLLQENKSIASALPLSPDASVFVRVDEDRMDVYKVIISGPTGTPYGCGLYEFHVFVPDAYPQVPPLVNLETTGGNQVRFNPNLYSCGKVCLSLLGTWHGGAKTSGWDSQHSTLLQVLISIQSLIMVPDPYFNEPGYDGQQGTEQGEALAAQYRNERIAESIRLAMVNQIRAPPVGFEKATRLHFSILGDRILEQCRRWARAAHAAAVATPGSYDWGRDIARQTLALEAELACLRADMARAAGP